MAQASADTQDLDEERARYLREAKGEFLKYRDELSRSSKGPTIKNLASAKISGKEINLENCMENLSLAYDQGDTDKVDKKAYWIGQREGAYLTKGMMDKGERIGTDNLQQCVAIIIDGTLSDSEDRLVALMHVDRFTTQESIGSMLEHFKPGQLDVKIYGARDQGTLKGISKDNLETARKVIGAECDKRGMDPVITEEVKEKATSSEIVYDPASREIRKGVTPVKGWETKSARLAARSLQNQQLGHDAGSKTIRDRDAQLRYIELTEPNALDKYTQREILLKYDGMCKGYRDKFTDKLDLLGTSSDKDGLELAKFCAEEFTPFVKVVKSVLSERGCEFSMKDIYIQEQEVSAACIKIAEDLSREFASSAEQAQAQEVEAALPEREAAEVTPEEPEITAAADTRPVEQTQKETRDRASSTASSIQQALMEQQNIPETLIRSESYRTAMQRPVQVAREEDRQQEGRRPTNAGQKKGCCNIL